MNNNLTDDVRNDYIDRADDPATSEKELHTLAMFEDDYLRIAVLCNPNISPDTLDMLAINGSRIIRQGVTGNKKTSLETLLLLSKDQDLYISDLAISSIKERFGIKVQSTHERLMELEEYRLLRYIETRKKTKQ